MLSVEKMYLFKMKHFVMLDNWRYRTLRYLLRLFWYFPNSNTVDYHLCSGRSNTLQHRRLKLINWIYMILSSEGWQAYFCHILIKKRASFCSGFIAIILQTKALRILTAKGNLEQQKSCNHAIFSVRHIRPALSLKV